jgi:RNA-directed DNA polymerase
MRVPPRRSIAEGLAAAFLAGPWSPSAMAERAAMALGQSPPWLRKLARSAHRAFGEKPPVDRFDDLVAHLVEDSALKIGGGRPPLHLRALLVPALAMRDVHDDWGLPRLATVGDVARWLELDVPTLTLFADWRGMARLPRDSRLGHYVCRWVPKRSGGARLLEAPKPDLKAIQRRILREILDRVPPHDAAHGFRRRRSVLTHAGPHAGRAVVLRMDLEDFFASVGSGRILQIFRALGYPQGVARVLTGLSTTRALVDPGPPLPPFASRSDVAAMFRSRQRYRARHLPQGAPTSPALANLAAFGVDVRLAAAAKRVGANYTRYADDLAFSGDLAFARRVPRFEALVAGVSLDEGFVVHHRKTRCMRRGTRQEVTGIVVNVHPGIGRDRFDQWKAVLHNCARFGPASQNRAGFADFRAHLEGVVAWVKHVQPEKGAKLEALLRKVAWPPSLAPR